MKQNIKHIIILVLALMATIGAEATTKVVTFKSIIFQLLYVCYRKFPMFLKIDNDENGTTILFN